MNFSDFDTRHYPTLHVREGYSGWVATYEQTVVDEMDVRLLERVRSVDWAAAKRTLDLACGTGRTGEWLRRNGVRWIEGIDLTPAMLAVAQSKGAHRQLVNGDALRLPFSAGVYDLVMESLADEHIADLSTLYREVARVMAASGHFVIVGYHPHFLMLGIQTHYHRESGEAVAIECYIHLLSDHVKAAQAVGLTLREMDERIIDDEWIAQKPEWAKYRHRPVSFAMVFQKRPS